MTNRPDWNTYFLAMCNQVATRSPCVRRGVGVVITSSDHAILSTGYNGPPARCDHATEETCIRKDIPSGETPEISCCLHAEANAIALAAKNGTALREGTLYCNLPPCRECAKLVINAGIRTIIYYSQQGYPDQDTAKLYDQAKVEVLRVTGPVTQAQLPILDKQPATRWVEATTGWIIVADPRLSEEGLVSYTWLTGPKTGRDCYKTEERFRECFILEEDT